MLGSFIIDEYDREIHILIILITTDWPLTAITVDISDSRWKSIINRIGSFNSSEAVFIWNQTPIELKLLFL